MQNDAATIPKRLPWYLWPLALPVLVVTIVVVVVPLAVLSLLLTPYYWLYPERHAQQADFEGTEQEKARLHRWRAAYQRLPFIARLRHAIERSRRQRRRSA